MKRSIKWLIDWLTDWIRQFCWKEVVAFEMSGLAIIVLAIMMFVPTDKVPTTPSDYEQLEDQVNVTQQDPGCGEIITAEFENDECKTTAKFVLIALVLGLIIDCVDIYLLGNTFIPKSCGMGKKFKAKFRNK